MTPHEPSPPPHPPAAEVALGVTSRSRHQPCNPSPRASTKTRSEPCPPSASSPTSAGPPKPSTRPSQVLPLRGTQAPHRHHSRHPVAAWCQDAHTALIPTQRRLTRSHPCQLPGALQAARPSSARGRAPKSHRPSGSLPTGAPRPMRTTSPTRSRPSRPSSTPSSPAKTTWSRSPTTRSTPAGKDIEGRPELLRLLEDAADGSFDTVLVHKIDRWSGRLADLLATVEFLDRHDVAFASATEPIDTTSPLRRLFLQILGSFAEFERGLIVERVTRGIEAKRNAGLPLAMVGFGLRKEADGVVEKDPDTFPVVERIFRDYKGDLIDLDLFTAAQDLAGKRASNTTARRHRPLRGRRCRIRRPTRRAHRPPRSRTRRRPLEHRRQGEAAQQVPRRLRGRPARRRPLQHPHRRTTHRARERRVESHEPGPRARRNPRRPQHRPTGTAKRCTRSCPNASTPAPSRYARRSS